MKVNMTPNPLDVVTIHASQGDTEARQWEFELHNNGELIDTSDITEQLFFKAYKGGTEQILPENTSTPTTSPFKGDIKYPQGLLTDQEFLYRQSPTEEDGLAKITDIKGNTLVWNQLCRTLESGNWALVGAGTGTLTFADGVATFSTSNNYGRFLYTPGNLVNGHKYLLSVEIKAYANASINYALGSQTSYASQGCVCPTGTVSDDKWHRYTGIGTFTSGTDDKVLVQNNSGASNLQEIQVRNIMYFDLTQMGLDISSPSEFTSLFPLPYYAYNQGTLLSFNGNGIKTVGFNLAERWSSGNTSAGYASALGVECELLPNTSYCVSFVGNSGNRIYPNENLFTNTARITCNGSRQFVVLTTLASISKATTSQYQSSFGWRIFKNDGGNTVNSVFSDVCVNFNNSSRNGEYEPYTESNLYLPVSQYFPTGMKSAGTVYDELTPTKAITRIGALNIDSSTTIGTWESSDGWTANLILNTYKPNGAIKSDKFEYIGSFNGASSFATSAKAKGGYCLGILENSNRVYFYSSSATTVNDLINAIRGTNLYYELATPIEASFSTASLVTENAEIPLSNEDGVLIGKCTEQLSENPGFIDAKIKLADEDGECYSNKIQLHVERSPQ